MNGVRDVGTGYCRWCIVYPVMGEWKRLEREGKGTKVK